MRTLETMELSVIPIGGIEANCVLLSDPDRNEAVVVDPGAEAAYLLDLVRSMGLSVRAILLSHGHYDHVGAVAETAESWGCPVFLDKADHGLYTMQEFMIREYSGGRLHKDLSPYGNELLEFGPNLLFRIHHTPGHSTGSVCIEPRDGNRILLTGDTLFQGSVGRTDIPGADPRALQASLRFLMKTFRGYTLVPGHGPSTTMESEEKENYFLRDLPS